MKSILFALFFLLIENCILAQDYPAAEQKWVSHHTLMATGRAVGRKTPAIVRKLRKDYSRVVKDDRQIKRYSKQNHRQLDQEFKRNYHSAKWLMRHKSQPALAQKG